MKTSDSIKDAASIMVWDMLQEYKGNATDARPEWRGLLPDPPYAWWLGGVSYPTLSLTPLFEMFQVCIRFGRES